MGSGCRQGVQREGRLINARPWAYSWRCHVALLVNSRRRVAAAAAQHRKLTGEEWRHSGLNGLKGGGRPSVQKEYSSISRMPRLSGRCQHLVLLGGRRRVAAAAAQGHWLGGNNLYSSRRNSLPRGVAVSPLRAPAYLASPWLSATWQGNDFLGRQAPPTEVQEAGPRRCSSIHWSAPASFSWRVINRGVLEFRERHATPTQTADTARGRPLQARRCRRGRRRGQHCRSDIHRTCRRTMDSECSVGG